MTNISGVDAHWYRSDNFQKNDEPGLFIDDNVTLIPGLGVRITTRKQEAVCSTCSTQVFHYTSGTMNGDCGIAPGGGVRYGYLEAYIKLSRTYGIWPSFWLWTETPLCDGVETQPCDNCYRDTLGVAFPPVGFVCNSPSVATCDYEEIDVFEMTCGYVETNPNAYNYGMVSTWNDATTHYYTTGYEHPNETGINYQINDYSDFHLYGLEWTPSSLIWYVDGVPVRHIANPGLHQVTEVLLGQNLLPGIQHPLLGNYDPSNPNYQQWYDIPSNLSGYGFTSVNTAPAHMDVAYVKLYELAGGACPVTEVFTMASMGAAQWTAYAPTVKKSISIGPGTGAVPAAQAKVLRATDFIEIQGTFSVNAGSSLTLDVNPCN